MSPRLPLLSLLRATPLRPQCRAFASSAFWLAKSLKPFKLADIGEGITECEIVKWLVTPDQHVEEFDPIIEVMSDKATVEITSPFSGRVTNLSGAVGDMIKVGGVLCEVEVEVESGNAAPPPTDSPEVSDSAKRTEEIEREARPARGTVLATPATRRIAKENSISLDDVVGTGKDGRVTKGDVMDYVVSSLSPPTPPPTSPRSTPSLAPTSPAQGTITIPLSSVRRAMFKSMTASLQIPHFVYSETIDVTLLSRLRTELNAAIPPYYLQTLTPAQDLALSRSSWGSPAPFRAPVEGRYDRMTLLPLLIKALSRAMDEHPLFRSTLSPEADSLVLRESHDISIALSPSTSSEGLYTPLLPSVNLSSPYALTSQIAMLQRLAPKFPVENRGSATITLSNVGVVGGTTTMPIIPPGGQLAIGALGRTRVEPRFVDEGQAREAALQGTGSEGVRVEPRLVMEVSFSADHRVVEGIELARFVETWKRIVETPGRLAG